MPDLLERLTAALADRYAIESEIGRGGMATVFLARDLKHKRQVAIKVLHPELAATVGPDRFLREIETVAGLTHPHILPLYDSGEADGLLYYTMPYVTGESLRDRLNREGQLPLEEALRITREVAEALEHAHSAGIIHRDIKPANILFEGGHALVADFGLSRAIAEAGRERLTQTGLSAGTPAYMSPEQASDEEVDERSDLYALGCILYEMLAGETPYTGATARSIIAKKMSGSPPRVSVVRETVPQAVDDALLKVLARNPVDRFRTAAEFSAALEKGTGAQTGRDAPRWRPRQLAAVIMALVAGVAGIWALATRDSASTESTVPTAIPMDTTAIAILPFQVIGADSASPVWELSAAMGSYLEIKLGEEFGRRIADPGSVEERWRQAGGSLSRALPRDTELQLGRDLWVGALITGTVVQGDSTVMLAGSMVDVATGETRVSTVRVEGPEASPRQLYSLFDQLLVLLMTRDAGFSASGAERLRHFEPEAVKAYLAGEYSIALAADSSLVDAALAQYVGGEYDRRALQYAWDHQEQLSEKGRAFLQVLAAGRLNTEIVTRAGVIAAYEALARRWPEWRAPWVELGEELAVRGAHASVPDWRQRARQVFDRFDRHSGFDLWYLTELAFMEEDPARIRPLVDSLVVAPDPPFGWSGRMPSFKWRLAILEGDTAAATRALAQTPGPDWIPGFALVDGRGVEDADRYVATRPKRFYPDWDVWPWARGRDSDWRDALTRLDSEREYANRLTVTILRALLLGPSEDAMAAEALRQVAEIARGAGSPPPDLDTRVLASCWLTLWRLMHADTAGARETLTSISESDHPWKFAGWTGLIDVLLTRLEDGDVTDALAAADSIIGQAPLGGGPHALEIQNLLLSRLWREYGEPKRALAAIRRRQYVPGFVLNEDFTSTPEYLREEARLAAEVGDTTAAMDAYRHYFALRDSRPDHPTWAAQWDSMRVEYGELTGVETP